MKMQRSDWLKVLYFLSIKDYHKMEWKKMGREIIKWKKIEGAPISVIIRA